MQTSRSRPQKPATDNLEAPGSAGRTAGASTDTPLTRVSDILDLRRRSGGRPGTWTAYYAPTGWLQWVIVEDETNEEIARTRSQADARLITDQHNSWLPLCNAWYIGRRALKDRENVLKLQETDQ